MDDIVKRLNYYNGQFLREQDFTDEQKYHIDRIRRHNVQLHTPGIASGLTVTANPGAISASVSPGTALDKEGRQIVLKDPYDVAFENPHKGQWVLVVISYLEEPADEATVGDEGMTRVLERPEVGAILETGAPAGDMRIRLARLRIAANGTIAEIDMSVRTPVGARVRPDETFERLRLSRQGGVPNQFPVLSSGAANRADLAGDLSVTGSITATGNISATGNLVATGNVVVTGTVDGRDVSADAATNQAHRDNTNNPHGVTATQVGAIVSVQGVSNAGGNIAMNGAGGITVAGNDTTNTITVTGSAPSSIATVSNPGGNIDFVGSGITITPDNGAAKKITFATNAAAIGALPAGEYLQRTLSVVSFGTGNVSGATSTINVAFQPKMIWASGRAYAQTVNNDDSYFGGVTHGYCRVNSPGSFTQYGHGPTLRRYSQTLGSAWSIRNHFTSGLATFDFDDRYVSPRRNVILGVYISSVTANQIVLTFTRDFRGWSEPVFYFVELYITILG